MIRFKCIYCGNKLAVKDNSSGKKGHCPKCSHLLVIPYSTQNRPAINADVSDAVLKEEEAVFKVQSVSDDINPTVYIDKAGWLVPAYDEISLFLRTVTLMVIAIVNPIMADELMKLLRMNMGELSQWIITFFVISLIGMCFCLYNVFTEKEMADWQKGTMLIFAVFANATTSIMAGYHLIKFRQATGLSIIFPIWNIINAVLLLIGLRIQLLDISCIVKRGVSPLRLLIGLFCTIVIVLLCNYFFKMYWAVTFSICIVYTTSFDTAVQNTLFNRFETKSK
jgi:hypothetical protein